MFFLSIASGTHKPSSLWETQISHKIHGRRQAAAEAWQEEPTAHTQVVERNRSVKLAKADAGRMKVKAIWTRVWMSQLAKCRRKPDSGHQSRDCDRGVVYRNSVGPFTRSARYEANWRRFKPRPVPLQRSR